MKKVRTDSTAKAVLMTPTMLKNIPFNRDVVKLRRDKLRESIKANGFITPVIAMKTSILSPVGEEEYYILDGQHRLEVAIGLGMDVPVYVKKFPRVKTEDDIHQVLIQLNNSARPWKLADYIISYAKRGNSSYQKMLDFAKSEKMSIRYALIIFMNLTGISRRKAQKGELKLSNTDIEKARVVAKNVREMEELVGPRTLTKASEYRIASFHHPFNLSKFRRRWDLHKFNEYYQVATEYNALNCLYNNCPPK